MATRVENLLAVVSGELMEIVSTLEDEVKPRRKAQKSALNALALIHGGKEDYLPEVSDDTLEAMAERVRAEIREMPSAA